MIAKNKGKVNSVVDFGKVGRNYSLQTPHCQNHYWIEPRSEPSIPRFYYWGQLSNANLRNIGSTSFPPLFLGHHFEQELGVLFVVSFHYTQKSL